MNVPSNRIAELGVIGACLDGGIETCLEVFDGIPDSAFFDENLKSAYRCLKILVSRGIHPDVVGLYNEWKRGQEAVFPADLSNAQDLHPKFLLGERSEQIMDCYRRRRALLAADRLRTAAVDVGKPIDESLREYEDDIAESRSGSPPILEPKRAAQDLIEDLQRRHDLQGKRSGFATGFPKWDDMTDGLQRGELWIIGARPNVGKTSIALNVAEEISFHQNVPCLFVTLEMSAVALNRRMLAMSARIDGSSIRRGSFAEQDFKRMTTFTAKLSACPFYFLDSPGGISISRLCNSIRASVRRWKIAVVIIDYLQKIRPDKKGEKRTYEIGDSTSLLVEVTKRENINCFALAQLNRDPDKGGRSPVLSDLADSKSIEADADFVGLLDRPIDGCEEKAQLIVAKQRDGERGKIPMTFEGRYYRFTEATRKPETENDNHPTPTSHRTNGSPARRVPNSVAAAYPASNE